MSDVARASMDTVNEQLEALGENVRLAAIETYTAWEEVGRTIAFDDRTLQMDSHWIPFDSGRWGVREIFWLSDQIEGTATGLSQEETQAAVSNAMSTWDGVICSTIPLTELPDYDIDWGITQWLEGFGGVPFWYADITHAGWLPGVFFDAALEEPGAGEYVIGATFTYIWVDGSVPTDIDNNGKFDVAFREIYYNNNEEFEWTIDLDYPIIDVETVVLHETGHGLSQGHFGTLFRTDANGKFHFAPRAVMNAGYTGMQQDLTGTDLGGHCSIWGAWPYK
jgi:hypothetical protein